MYVFFQDTSKLEPTFDNRLCLCVYVCESHDQSRGYNVNHMTSHTTIMCIT